MKDQNQEGGDGSTNLQGQSITIHQGISYADAKEIALDVYKANFLALASDAAETARQRAEEITDDFLKKLTDENEAALSQMSTPGMQSALYEAQKQYAKTGDKDLQGLLVDILVDRAGEADRTIHQIVLDESLQVAAKLTTEQIDALTLNFLLTQTKNHGLGNLDVLEGYLKSKVIPFLGTITDSSSCYEHLEYAGCGSIMQFGNIHPIEKLFRDTYPGLFCKGFSKEDFDKELSDVGQASHLLMPCFHDSSLFQLRAIDEDVLRQQAEKVGVDEKDFTKIKNFFNRQTMPLGDIRNFLAGIAPEIQRLFDLWTTTKISKFTLTTVGISIAHANYRRRTGEKLELSIWIK